MNTATDHPELNTTELFKIIKWAERDEQWLDQYATNWRTWGRWDQGHWGFVLPGPDVDGNLDFLSPEEKREILNGACQTAYCIAGQAAAQAGYRLQLEESGVTSDGSAAYDHAEGLTASLCVKQVQVGTDHKGRPVYEDAPGESSKWISDVGREFLGLTSDESDALFAGDNEIVDLKEITNGMCKNRGLPLMFPDHEARDLGCQCDECI